VKIGEAQDLGPYTVRCALRFDNCAFPRYLIFRAERLIGAQLSCPNLSDCRWFDAGGRYAIKTKGIHVTQTPGARERGGDSTERLWK